MFLSRGGYICGSQRQLYYLASSLNRRRYIPMVVCREDGPFVEYLRAAGIETHVALLKPWRKWSEIPLRYAGVRTLLKLARDCEASLVHSSDLWMNGYMLRVARNRNVPSVLHVRMPMSPGQVRKHQCAQATALVAISSRVKRDLLRGRVPAEKITVIYDGVDLALFHPDRRRRNVLRRDFPHVAGPLVGIVGRIDRFKRQLDFLRAAARIVRNGTDSATFFVVGEVHDRQYHRQVRSLADESSLNGKVIFTGRRDDMPDVLASLDVLLTLSGGSVMIEAMACGTPVISAWFTKPNDSEIVRNRRTGLLVPPGETTKLDAALRQMIEDASLRERMGRDARRHAEARFGHEYLAAETQRLYDRLLGT